MSFKLKKQSFQHGISLMLELLSLQLHIIIPFCVGCFTVGPIFLFFLIEFVTVGALDSGVPM